jgi:hypothetical protein
MFSLQHVITINIKSKHTKFVYDSSTDEYKFLSIQNILKQEVLDRRENLKSHKHGCIILIDIFAVTECTTEYKFLR